MLVFGKDDGRQPVRQRGGGGDEDVDGVGGGLAVRVGSGENQALPGRIVGGSGDLQDVGEWIARHG